MNSIHPNDDDNKNDDLDFDRIVRLVNIIHCYERLVHHLLYEGFSTTIGEIEEIGLDEAMTKIEHNILQLYRDNYKVNKDIADRLKLNHTTLHMRYYRKRLAEEKKKVSE